MIQIGTRVYYTGDMANLPSLGTVTKYYERGKYNPEAVEITFDEERFEGDTKVSRMVPLVCFGNAPGDRFRIVKG